jgi:hypothetical protein
MLKAMKKIFTIASLLSVALFSMFALPCRAQAKGSPADSLPALQEFIAQVVNGDAQALRGVYIPRVLALPVVQQPNGNESYIASASSVLTQFQMAGKAGSVGILAHNYLAGRHFSLVEPGDQIILVYGNARTETFTVKSIQRYKALPKGMYKNIETRAYYDTGELFQRVYSGTKHVTLQTCIEKNGSLTWGRLFVIATAQGVESAQAAPPPPAPPKTTLLGWPLNVKPQSKPAYRPRPGMPR